MTLTLGKGGTIGNSPTPVFEPVQLADVPLEMTGLGRLVEDLRQQYFAVNPAFRPNTAIDVEAGAYLIESLREVQPKVLIDLGSGFSTICIRHWVTHESPDSEVWTTDHNWKWLGQTAVALESMNLRTEHMHHQSNWLKLQWRPVYDWMFVDHHNPATRVGEFLQYMATVARDSLVIFDDWQFPHLSIPIAEQLAGTHWAYQELPQTKDEYGRWMARAFRQGEQWDPMGPDGRKNNTPR